MTRFTIMFFVILSLASCDRRIEKLKQIPVEYRGQWIDEFKEFKKVITDNEIYHYEILENGEIDPISKEIVEIYKVKRKDCTDCLSYGIEVILKSDLGETEFLYLNQFHLWCRISNPVPQMACRTPSGKYVDISSSAGTIMLHLQKDA